MAHFRVVDVVKIVRQDDSMAGTATQIGHGLAKVLGIKLHYRNPQNLDTPTQGESVYSVSSADSFVEHEPTSWEWIQSVVPNGGGILRWAYNLFPFTHWIDRYNVQWLYGDLVAGSSLKRRSCIAIGLADGRVRYHGRLRCGPSVHGLC